MKGIGDKITSITNLATKVSLNAKINEVKGKISSINGLATTAALATVEDKIPDVSNFVKKADDNFSKKSFTTFDWNKFTKNILDTKIKEKKLVNESDIADFVKKTCFDGKLKYINKSVSSNKTEHVLIEDGLKEL